MTINLVFSLTNKLQVDFFNFQQYYVITIFLSGKCMVLSILFL